MASATCTDSKEVCESFELATGECAPKVFTQPPVLAPDLPFIVHTDNPALVVAVIHEGFALGTVVQTLVAAQMHAPLLVRPPNELPQKTRKTLRAQITARIVHLLLAIPDIVVARLA